MNDNEDDNEDNCQEAAPSWVKHDGHDNDRKDDNNDAWQDNDVCQEAASALVCVYVCKSGSL